MKGHYVFRSESRPGYSFTCLREKSNPHSSDTIIVKLSDGSNVGHVSDPLARVLAPRLDGGKIKCMEGTLTGVARSALERVWVSGRGIEFPCEYVCTVHAKKDREIVKQTLLKVQKSRKRRRED